MPSVMIVCSRRSTASSCDISFRSVIPNRNRYQRCFLLRAESTTADGDRPADSLSFSFLTVAPLPVVRRLFLGTRKARVGGGDERKKIVNTRWRPMEETAVYPAGHRNKRKGKESRRGKYISMNIHVHIKYSKIL